MTTSLNNTTLELYNELNIKFTKLCNELLVRNNSCHIASPNSIKMFAKSEMLLEDYIKNYDKEFENISFKRIDERDTYYREYCDIIKIPYKYSREWSQYTKRCSEQAPGNVGRQARGSLRAARRSLRRKDEGEG